jgi:metallophosphoesterase superfamily enzyme
MTKYLILNDTHLGAKRQGGVTPQSQEALRGFLQAEFRKALSHEADQVVIAGDLFDHFTVDPRDILECYKSLAWAMEQGKFVTLLSGNHDFRPRGSDLSSFDFLADVLWARFEGQMQVISSSIGLGQIGDGIWAIPSMPNQDLFDLELEKAYGLRTGTVAGDGLVDLIVHANYDNKFTQHSDHSLNVSKEFARKFTEAGGRILFGHEHVAKTDLGGKVVVFGNQTPASIADCLGNTEKYAHLLDSKGNLSKVQTWECGGYREVDWRDLDNCYRDADWLDPANDQGVGFVRVVGHASSAEAELVVDAIAKYRSKSQAFVVGDAVAREGLEGLGTMEDVSLEDIQGFDVFGALLEGMSEREAETLKGLQR